MVTFTEDTQSRLIDINKTKDVEFGEKKITLTRIGMQMGIGRTPL